MMTFVLVHGSWHQGRAWHQVAQALRAEGHCVHTPDVRADGGNVAPRFEDSVLALEEFLRRQDLRDIVLAGHSFGGAVVASVAARQQQRIARLVFLAAIIPRDGHSVLDEMPPDYARGFEAMARESADDSVFPLWPVWRDAFIGDADVDTARAAFGELVREPFAPVKEKLDLSAFYALETPRSYIHCTEDIVFPPGEWGWFPRMYSRLGLCRLVLAQGSHEMMYSNPAALAAALVKAGRP